MDDHRVVLAGVAIIAAASILMAIGSLTVAMWIFSLIAALI